MTRRIAHNGRLLLTLLPALALVVAAVTMLPIGAGATSPARAGLTIAPQYTLTDLGTLGGESSIALGINDAGQIVGQASRASGAAHAFLYADGTMTDIAAAYPGLSIAYGINAYGEVVLGVPVDGPLRAFHYANGELSAIDAFSEQWGIAYAINDAGQITGMTSFDSGATGHAFLYTNGAVHDLGALGSDSVGQAINNTGQVAGYAYIQQETGRITHAFHYAHGELTDLGTFGSASWSSIAYGINDLVLQL